MDEHSRIVQSAADIEVPVTIGREAYVSRDYARAENERLWRKAWLQAGRVEDIPGEGDFLTFDIGDDSVIVVQSGIGRR